MDTLGVDENGYPVIIEYKRDRSENVINQGLFYLDWLMDHRGDFELLVRDRYGKQSSRPDRMERAAPNLHRCRLHPDDEHAVKQMGRNIELVRYRKFGDDLLLLELLTAVSATTSSASAPANGSEITQRQDSIRIYRVDGSPAFGALRRCGDILARSW